MCRRKSDFDFSYIAEIEFFGVAEFVIEKPACDSFAVFDCDRVKRKIRRNDGGFSAKSAFVYHVVKVFESNVFVRAFGAEIVYNEYVRFEYGRKVVALVIPERGMVIERAADERKCGNRDYRSAFFQAFVGKARGKKGFARSRFSDKNYVLAHRVVASVRDDFEVARNFFDQRRVIAEKREVEFGKIVTRKFDIVGSFGYGKVGGAFTRLAVGG